MADLLISEGAEEDFVEALRWYAERIRQAADGFEAEFALALDAIGEHPDLYPKCGFRHRFYLMKRYPFQVIYREVAEEDLLIVAVAHTSRRPSYWSRR